MLALAQIHPTPYKFCCVVSDSDLASKVGAKILKDGGNAVDAAIATGFALAVAFPAAGNIGGGGFMVVRMADGRTVAIDYREMAPKASTKDMYLDDKQNVTQDSLIGYKAAGVPGTTMGMWEAHKRFGKLPWNKLVDPSVRLSRDGFVIDREFASSLRGSSTLFKRFPTSWSQFCRDGKFFEAGEKFSQPDLAITLSRIRDKGADGFYKGETANLIAADMAANKGLMSKDDLANYKVEFRQPQAGSYKGFDILTMPPPSSGGVCLLQMLGILEGYDLKPLGWNSSEYLHLLVEAMKRSFADRSQYMGDPGFVDVPVAKLLSPEYIKARRESIDPAKSTPATSIAPGLEPIKEGEHTTHFSVADREGNMVSNTYTLNTGFGSGAVVKGAGFLLNNEMDDFAAKPGVPNAYGLIQGSRNSIAPGKRPLSSMTPTIVLKDGKPYLVVGSPGGPTIINTVLQTFLNIVEFGMSVQQAVAAPRFHHQWLPDEVRYETFGVSVDVRKALEAKGHKFARSASSMGSCNAILVAVDGWRMAGVDPRISGAASAGY
jgi:gamma-glutamyltranspeptidase/glutathione hydrolase